MGLTQVGRRPAAPAGLAGRRAPPRRGATRAVLSGVVALVAFLGAMVIILALAVGRLGR